MLTYVYLAIGVCLLLLVIAFFLARNAAAPSMAMIRAIENTIVLLRREALRNVLPEHEEASASEFKPERIANQSNQIKQTIRFIYTVENHENGFLHVISSQLLKAKPVKYQIQCMLFAMMILNRQLGESGINQESVTFDVDQSEFGTHYVLMKLTQKQHEQFAASLS